MRPLTGFQLMLRYCNRRKPTPQHMQQLTKRLQNCIFKVQKGYHQTTLCVLFICTILFHHATEYFVLILPNSKNKLNYYKFVFHPEMAARVFSVLLLLCLAINSCLFDSIECLPLQGAKKNVVYSRFIRRRPIHFSNNYVDEVIEVFHTQRRPPPYAFLHDEDLTRFVRCDYDPSMPDCYDGPNFTTSTNPDIESTPLTTSTTPKTTTPTSFFSWGLASTTTTEQSTKLTESGVNQPASSAVSEEYEEENGNNYEEEDENAEPAYYNEEVEGSDNGISDDATELNATADMESSVKNPKQETTTKAFSWSLF